MDVIMLAIGLGFFALSVGYAYRLRPALRRAVMTFDYSLAGARDRRAADLPHLRSAEARAVLKGPTAMTVIGWIQILLYLRDRRRAREAARRLHDARLQRRAHVPLAGPAAGRSGALLARRRRREARAALAHLHGRHAAVPRRRLPDSLRADARCRRSCRSIRPSSPPSRRISPSTPRSASSPTPTGRTTAAKARCPISCRCSA